MTSAVLWDDRRVNFDTHTVDLSAGRVAEYETHGSGEPLLYFAGGPGENAALLRDDAQRLAERFAVHLIEPHGSGGSSAPSDPSQYDPVGHASFYEEVRQALGLERVNIMGFSFGGAVALAYAGLFPDVTARCISVAGRALGAAAGADSDEEMERALTRHRHASWYPSARRTWDEWPERVSALTDSRELDEMMLTVMPLYMAHPEQPSVQVRIESWRRDLRSNLSAALAWEGGLWETLDLRAELANIVAPTLLLAGEQDLICGPVAARQIADVVNHAETVTIPDCGHFIPTEAPAAFDDAVFRFCERHPFAG